MELVTIGEAAQMLGLNASALRYYEDRGLVTPERCGGKRMYRREHLRRLAFIQLMQCLGIRLDAASAVLDEPSDQWRGVVREQITAIEELIARANGAREFLEHAHDRGPRQAARRTHHRGARRRTRPART
jgi:MerR family transcriptional regulator, copper efflux regulator